MNRECEKKEVSSRKAKVVLEAWLRERKEPREMTLAANAEVRRIWMESDRSKAGSG